MDWNFLKKKRPSILLTSSLLLLALFAATFLGCEGDYERPHDFAGVDSLNRPDCRLGVFAGTGGEPVAHRLFPSANVIVFDDASDAGAAMLSGRLEGFIGAEHILNLFCRAYPLRFRILDEALERQPARVLVNEKNKLLLGEVNRFIADFKRKGTYDDMFLRWCLADTYVPIPEIPEAAGSNGVLRVGMCGLVEPSNFIDEDGKLTGYDVEFALRLGLALDRKVTFHLDPDRDQFDELKNGAIDAIIDFCCCCSPDLKPGVAASDGYLDSDKKVVIAEAQPGLDKKLDALMLEGTRFGMTDALIGDVRVRLFVNGFVNTASIALLAVLLGFGIARLVSKSERYWRPRCTLRILDAVIAFVKWTPPLVLLLVFHSALMPWAAPWLTAVVALAIWFAAYLEPVAASHPLAWLPVMRLRLPVLLQWTCVVGYISVFDLTMAVDLVCGRSAKAFVPLLAVALAYGLLAWLLDRGVAWIESRVKR